MSRYGLILGGLGAAFWVGASCAAPVELTFPGPAETTASRAEAVTSFRMPIGPFAGGSLPTQLAEGALTQTAFRLDLPQPSTLEVMQSLRDQIAAAGYQVMFECETDACGGYDFRYGTDVLPEPDMHIDLGDFRYLAAQRPGSDRVDYVSLMVSRSTQQGFVQLTQVGGAGAQLTASTKSAPAKPLATKPEGLALPKAEAPGQTLPSAKDLGQRLELGQAQVLEDLVFASGSSTLTEGEYPSLAALAAWLKADTQRKVTLVGHTDASGGLAGNIKLSQLRAESVRQALLYGHKVAPDQVVAEGVGYLAPRDSNQTEEGRRKNRRVEVMATSTQLLAP